MPDLLWDDVRSLFDPETMGALPDLRVADTSAADWQALFDLIRSSGWAWEYSEDGVPADLPPAQEVLDRPEDAAMPELRVRPTPDVLMVFRPWVAESIDFDVDLRELQGQGGVDTLCEFVSTVGRHLGKSVVLAPETDPARPVLGFDPHADRVVVL
ncbi:hypothetical protein ACWDYH_27820 [Nocardia goodfellowii]|uniref:GNAT family N-acetyltransferase n=1 Tax=Nocardia goodfellowii TaxID=882446 RepID=A0ABS4QTV0_9NOCA|nr:hypothetical protein [Nocardia goodfellowii]MBP2194469.1 hypothetical protein [Nocardia goodfellowii]